MTPEEILRLLKNEQAGFALEALKRPNLGNDFEYGYRSGIVAGLEIAMGKIINIFKEDEEADKDV